MSLHSCIGVGLALTAACASVFLGNPYVAYAASGIVDVYSTAFYKDLDISDLAQDPTAFTDEKEGPIAFTPNWREALIDDESGRPQNEILHYILGARGEEGSSTSSELFLSPEKYHDFFGISENGYKLLLQLDHDSFASVPHIIPNFDMEAGENGENLPERFYSFKELDRPTKLKLYNQLLLAQLMRWTGSINMPNYFS